MSDVDLAALERRPYVELDLGERQALFTGLLRTGRLFAHGLDARWRVRLLLSAPTTKKKSKVRLRVHTGRTRYEQWRAGSWWTPTGDTVWWRDGDRPKSPEWGITPLSDGGVVWLDRNRTLAFATPHEVVEYLAERAVAFEVAPPRLRRRKRTEA